MASFNWRDSGEKGGGKGFECEGVIEGGVIEEVLHRDAFESKKITEKQSELGCKGGVI